MVTETHIPDTALSWINSEFIEEALRKLGETNAKILHHTVSPATSPGDNYLSVIYRVTAQLEGGVERSFLVKVLPSGEELTAYAKESRIFQMEAELLSDVIPRMQELLESAAPGRWPALAARCPAFGAGPVDFVALEDLRPLGFKMAERRRGLGLRHALLAMRSLARFHAAGHALLQAQPALLQRFDNYFRRPLHHFVTYVHNGVAAAAEACREWPGFQEYYPEAIDKFQQNAMETIRILNDPRPNSFNVLLHGDFYTNNMMFKYDDNGKPLECRMVDFQVAHVGCYALDVLYFMNTSLSTDVSTHHENLLLREYHFALEETLDTLGIKAPSLAELQAALDAHGSFVYFAAFTTVPLLLSDEAADMDGLMAGDRAAFHALYRKPLCAKWLQRLLPVYRRRGWLDA